MTPEGMKIVVLDKVRVASQQMLSDELFVANHVATTARYDSYARAMVYNLQSFVLGKNHGRIDVERQWPADWWQAIRERWFPKWWLKRWPVRYCKVSIHETVWHVCPHLNIKTDNLPHLEFMLHPGVERR